MVEGTQDETWKNGKEHKGWGKTDNISHFIAHKILNVKFPNGKKKPNTKYALQDRERLEVKGQ